MGKQKNQQFGSFKELGKVMGRENKKVNSTSSDFDKPQTLVWWKRTYKEGLKTRYIFSSDGHEEIGLHPDFYDKDKNQNKELKRISNFLNEHCFLYAYLKIDNGKPVITKFEKDMPYRCPKDTRDLVESDTIGNFNLKLNRFAQFKGDKFKFFDDKKLIVKPAFNQELVKAIQKRHEQLRMALFPNKDLYKELQFSPDWHLIVGLGNESVYETSLTLHHIYGIPYIPASAIKGVTRNYVINEKFQGDEKKAMQDEEFCQVFGSDDNSYDGKAREGKVIFFDAFPDAFPIELSEKSIQPDVMNVHYPDYYGGSGNQPPTDTQNPNPIFFLTVQNTTFRFIIGVKKSQEGLLGKTEEWLKSALKQRGIGAKTAVGYGYMKET